jgi:hypothetical protein
VLAELREKWESKLMESHVMDESEEALAYLQQRL